MRATSAPSAKKSPAATSSPDLATLTLLALVTVILLLSPAGAQQPDRSKPPQPGRPPSLTLPVVQKRALSNGIPVWIVERHAVPVVSVDLMLTTGSAADPVGSYGLAQMTAAMLDEGAGTRDSLALADEIDYLGATMGANTTFDATSVSLFVPVARLDQALPLFADIALRPTFPQQELDRMKAEWLVEFQQVADDPTSMARLAYPRVLYGQEHRFGTGLSGTPAVVQALTREQLAAFHAARYRPDKAAFFVVGDVRADAVLAQLETQFGTWKAGPLEPEPVVNAGTQHGPRHIYLVDKPGAAQSVVRIGWLGVDRATPDYFALEVLNTILGGSFTSRLNQNLRETHGYTYGARSGFDMRRLAGPFVATAAVQTDKTAEAVHEFFVELEGIRKPIPAAELDKAKNNLAYSFPSNFATNSDVAGQLEEQYLYGLPDNYYATYVDRVLAVTPAEVQAAAQKYIQPESFAVVIVGDLKVIRPKLEALKLGPITVVDFKDVL